MHTMNELIFTFLYYSLGKSFIPTLSFLFNRSMLTTNPNIPPPVRSGEERRRDWHEFEKSNLKFKINYKNTTQISKLNS